MPQSSLQADTISYLKELKTKLDQDIPIVLARNPSLRAWQLEEERKVECDQVENLRNTSKLA